MESWKANWTGAIKNFPGLESIALHYSDLNEATKEHINHLNDTVLTLFSHHPGAEGAVGVEGTVDPDGQHSAVVTLGITPVTVGGQPTSASRDQNVGQPGDSSGEQEPGTPAREQFIQQPGGPVGGSENEPGPDPAPEDGALTGQPSSETPGEDADQYVIQAQGNGISVVYGPTAGGTFESEDDAVAGMTKINDSERLGEHPIKTAVKVTAEQVATLDIEGLPE